MYGRLISMTRIPPQESVSRAQLSYAQYKRDAQTLTARGFRDGTPSDEAEKRRLPRTFRSATSFSVNVWRARMYSSK